MSQGVVDTYIVRSSWFVHCRSTLFSAEEACAREVMIMITRSRLLTVKMVNQAHPGDVGDRKIEIWDVLLVEMRSGSSVIDVSLSFA